jgi:hypothetical protein
MHLKDVPVPRMTQQIGTRQDKGTHGSYLDKTFDCAGPLGSSDEADQALCSKATTGLFPSRTASFGGKHPDSNAREKDGGAS